MVDVASAFGIATLIAAVLMAAVLTWLGFKDEGPTTAAEADEDEAAGA